MKHVEVKMSIPSKFFFIHTGCNANQADAATIGRYLAMDGGFVAEDLDQSDTVVVMTCAFTAERQEESLRQIRRAFGPRQEKKVLVSGCLPDINPTILEGFGKLTILKPRQLDQMAKLLKKTDLDMRPSGIKRVRVSRGCLGKCSFCAIPKATGSLYSRPAEEIISEVQRYLENGAYRIMLSGEDVGAYGRDIGDTLGNLLKGLLALKFDFEVAVESINPHWLKSLLTTNGDLLADRRISRRWYIPVQAASNRMLRLMRRPYKVGTFERVISALREIRPDVYVVTDLVVGHPGEVMEDVIEAAALLERSSINSLEAMKFDAHEGTDAAVQPGQVDESEKKKRVGFLIVQFVESLLRRSGGLDLSDLPNPLPINSNVRPRELYNYVRFWTMNSQGRLRFTADSVADLVDRIAPPAPVNMIPTT